jgi:hypothetical protein
MREVELGLSRPREDEGDADRENESTHTIRASEAAVCNRRDLGAGGGVVRPTVTDARCKPRALAIA